MKHPHLLKYYGAALKGREVYVVTEFMNGGSAYSSTVFLQWSKSNAYQLCADLSHILANKAVDIPWRLRCRIARDAMDGIAFLHSNEIVHRDIKTGML
jgi:serine/threonine protein kinase